MKKLKVLQNKKDFIILNKNNENDFSQILTKGFGNKKENKLYLNILEVIYLFENKKIEIFKIENKKEKKILKDDLFKLKQFNQDEYLIYKDLKKKGYIVKSGLKYGVSFRIYDKGIKPGEDHSLWLIETLNEKDKIRINNLIAKNRISHSTNKKLILAIIDSDFDIIYIENSWKRL